MMNAEEMSEENLFATPLEKRDEEWRQKLIKKGLEMSKSEAKSDEEREFWQWMINKRYEQS